MYTYVLLPYPLLVALAPVAAFLPVKATFSVAAAVVDDVAADNLPLAAGGAGGGEAVAHEAGAAAAREAKGAGVEDAVGVARAVAGHVAAGVWCQRSG